MARPPTPLDPQSGPLAVFALELRALRDSSGADAPTVDRISIDTGIARSTLYAALRGTRVPTRQVLAALVRVWGGNEAEWMAKRSAVEAETAAIRLQQKANLPAGSRRANSRLVTVTSPEVTRFWDDIAELRDRRGLTYRALAKRVQMQGSHVATPTLYDWLHGRHRVPDWSKVEPIIRALGEDTEEWQQRWMDAKRGAESVHRRIYKD